MLDEVFKESQDSDYILKLDDVMTVSKSEVKEFRENLKKLFNTHIINFL